MESTQKHPDRMVYVYSNPGCQPCFATKRKLDALGIEYMDVPAEKFERIGEFLAAHGLDPVAPLVVAGGLIDWESHSRPHLESWTGYRPDRIEALARG